MEEIGYGLLDRTLMEKITERWHHGGVGVILLHIDRAGNDELAAIRHWMEQERRLFWQYRMNHDYYFLLGRQREDVRLDRLIAQSAKALRECLRAAQRGGQRDYAGYAIGSSAIYPSGVGRSAESMIYGALKEALSAASEPLRQPVRGRNDEQDEPADAGQAPVGDAFQIGALAKQIPVFDVKTRVSEVGKLFEMNERLQGAVIVAGQRPVGLIMKEKLHQLLAGPFGIALYWNRPIEKIMDDHPLIVDAESSVESVSQLATARDHAKLYDVVVITRDDRLLGAASIRSILECMTNLRTEEARTSNPLTGLPGNASIVREMQRRIAAGRPFAVLYADMDYFKWFNDRFGFSQGDALIRYCASVLQEETRQAAPNGSFVGHIGGDDFIVIADAGQGETLCRSVLSRFDDGVVSFYGGADNLAVSDRSGNRVDQEGVSLSVSLVRWDGDRPVTPENLSQAAARLKKRAKSMRGSSYVSGGVFEMHRGEERNQRGASHGYESTL
ncbi:GGDEF domain-containing protein [Paenibacillus xanthanilyticus]|uniref:GGDEF domain-containing protein n=1 Tax=Paenibacillus xanthanilyticus TaxID=1783531 RepID=A0ABV8K2N0_9BACL